MSRGSGSVFRCLFFVRDSVLPYIKCPGSYKAVLFYLASFANPDGTQIFQSSRSIAKGIGYDRNTVRDAVQFWIQTKFLSLVRPGNGRGHANEYRILAETGEPRAPYLPKKEGIAHPFMQERGEPEGDKGVNSNGERGEKTGAPFTPTESPNKHTDKPDHRPPADVPDDDDRIQKLFDEANNLLTQRGEDPVFVSVALEFLDERSFKLGKGPPATIQWYLTAFSNLKHDSQLVEEIWDKAQRRRQLRGKYMPDFTGVPADEPARLEFNRRVAQASSKST
jgi:hypothetical protein